MGRLAAYQGSGSQAPEAQFRSHGNLQFGPAGVGIRRHARRWIRRRSLALIVDTSVWCARITAPLSGSCRETATRSRRVARAHCGGAVTHRSDLRAASLGRRARGASRGMRSAGVPHLKARSELPATTPRNCARLPRRAGSWRVAAGNDGRVALRSQLPGTCRRQHRALGGQPARSASRAARDCSRRSRLDMQR